MRRAMLDAVNSHELQIDETLLWLFEGADGVTTGTKSGQIRTW